MKTTTKLLVALGLLLATLALTVGSAAAGFKVPLGDIEGRVEDAGFKVPLGDIEGI